MVLGSSTFSSDIFKFSVLLSSNTFHNNTYTRSYSILGLMKDLLYEKSYILF